MKAKPTEGRQALEEFARTMQALFRIRKSETEESRKPEPRKKQPKKPN
jgi:hypothetical protein